MAILTCKEFWEFSHSSGRLASTRVGQVLGKSIRSFSHRVHKEPDFNRIIAEKMKVQLLAEIRTVKEQNKIL